MTKPNKDGWIRHRGGKCSAPELSVVEVRLRNGEILPAYDCERFAWEHSAVESGRQIMSYRVVDMREPASYDDDYCYCDCEGPTQWRDRILEIDAATIALGEERASLVARLKYEGFVLIQGDDPNSAAESDQKDMSDWRNWEKGDIILCVKSDCYPSELTVGKLYIYHGDGDVIDDGGAEQGYPIRFGECFKWHSRPTN